MRTGYVSVDGAPLRAFSAHYMEMLHEHGKIVSLIAADGVKRSMSDLIELANQGGLVMLPAPVRHLRG